MIKQLILKCGNKFVALKRELEVYVASGIFKYGKNGQEVKYFNDKDPENAMIKLYNALENDKK